MRKRHVEKQFSLRLHRIDGTSKLLLGITGAPPKVGWRMLIRAGRDEFVTAKILHPPRGDEPAEAMEEVQQVSHRQMRRVG